MTYRFARDIKLFFLRTVRPFKNTEGGEATLKRKNIMKYNSKHKQKINKMKTKKKKNVLFA